MMGRPSASLGWICLLVMLFVSSSSRAQDDWDPQRYTELAQEGQRLFEEALATPETRIATRERIFLLANSRLKAALAMIRLAFETGAVDDEREAALGDFFTLMENLIVVWIHLDKCWPAERLWDVATHHPGLSSSRQRDLFDPLLVKLRECRDRAPLFDWFEYHALVDDAETARFLAPTAPDPHQRLTEATRSSREALFMLEPAVFDGTLLDSPLESPPDELMARYRMTFELLVELGECEAAAERVNDARRDAVVLLQVDVAEVERWRTELDDCASVDNVVAEAEERVEPVLSIREGVGYALVGMTAIMVAGVFILDATSKSDRDELEQLQSECAVGPCDTYRAELLADDIDTTKVMVGVMIGGAVVAGTVALVLLLTGRDEQPSGGQGGIVPVFGSDGFGAAIHFTY